MKKITIEDIRKSLYDANLDTEYREALAKVMQQFGYVDDSPLNLYFGGKESRKKLEEVETKSLTADELSEIIHMMMYKMRDDFQYVAFKPIAMKYLEIVDKMRKENNIDTKNIENNKIKKPQCKIDTPIMFEIIGEVSKILKQNNMNKEAIQMIEKATLSYDYDEAFNIIKNYVEVIEEKEEIKYEEDEFE